MTNIKCPWCGKEVSIEEWSTHIDSHKDPAYDRKLIRESRNLHEPPPPGIDPEMIRFSQCLAKKLTPLPSPGEYPSGPNGAIARSLRARKEYEREIYEVLLGNRSLDDFFSHAKQRWDMDKYRLSQMFYDCLKGLRDEEAKKLRKEWGNFLEKLKGKLI